ncbi:hypothetical protein ACFYXH_10410 [Streptomyces sp. NPDC002730]|uniref:hypothetical protein n=1 Tax=Streptomyces sp. NPDC002730 TaxID=3364662 RepID=UPI0036896091
MRIARIFGVCALTAAALMGTSLTAHAQSGGDDAQGGGLKYKIVQKDFPESPSGEEHTVLCPSGWKVFGGGVRVNSLDSVVLRSSYPAANGRGWVGAVLDAATPVDLTVYAICAKVKNG